MDQSQIEEIQTLYSDKNQKDFDDAMLDYTNSLHPNTPFLISEMLNNKQHINTATLPSSRFKNLQ